MRTTILIAIPACLVIAFFSQGCERQEAVAAPSKTLVDLAKDTEPYEPPEIPDPNAENAAEGDAEKGDGNPGESETSASSKDSSKKKKEISLFNGKDLEGWKEVNFGGEGEVKIVDGELRLGIGESMTAVVYDGDKKKLPTNDYEISLESNKLDGHDFLCGLTFPVRDDYATLIVGGWGGAVVGISSIDDLDASENETAQFMAFEKGRWYKIRLRVAEERIKVWIDDKEMIDVDIMNRKVSMRPGEIELCIPLGIASYQTRSAHRKIRLRRL